MITHVPERPLWIVPAKALVFIPHPVHKQIRAFPIVGCTPQRTVNHVVSRILVGHVKLRGHHHSLPLPGKKLRTAQDTMKIPCASVNAVVHR